MFNKKWTSCIQNQNLNRRHLLAGAASLTLVTACGKPASSPRVIPHPSIKWRMITSWPQSLDVIFGTLQTFTQQISKMTDGRFTIDLFAADEVVPALKVMDAVSDGSVECGHTASYYYLGKQLALAFGTTMPFGLTAQQQNAWLYHHGGLEAIQALYADFNLINFPAGNTGGQMGGWFKRKINSTADLQGLKMRIPGLGGEIMSRLGVNVQVIPGSEIFLALQQGAIDAADWIGPYDDTTLGLNKAAKYYYSPGWWEPGATLDALVNRSAWDKLPPDYQQIFKTAAYEANLSMLSQYTVLNQKAISQLQKDGTQVLTYGNDILQAARRETFELYQEKAERDQTFRKIYEPWKRFCDRATQWHQLNELKFSQFVASP